MDWAAATRGKPYPQRMSSPNGEIQLFTNIALFGPSLFATRFEEAIFVGLHGVINIVKINQGQHPMAAPLLTATWQPKASDYASPSNLIKICLRSTMRLGKDVGFGHLLVGPKLGAECPVVVLQKHG